MQKLDHYDAFLFDFDGLLVDSERLHYKSYLQMVKEVGYSLNWDLETYLTYALQSTEVLSKAVYDSVPHLFEHHPHWMKLREIKQRIYFEHLKEGHIALMPHVEEFLTHLSKLKKPMCVVTNTPLEHVNLIKSHIPFLDIIPIWITREDYEKAKPEPDSFLKGLEVLKNPKNPIGFEDSKKGIESLKGTSIQPVLVAPAFYPKLDKELLENVFSFHSMKDVMNAFTIS